MDRALRLIAERLPCSAAQIEAELAEQGLTAVGMSIEAIAAGAKLLDRPVRFKVVKIDNSRLAIQPDSSTPCWPPPTWQRNSPISTDWRP